MYYDIIHRPHKYYKDLVINDSSIKLNFSNINLQPKSGYVIIKHK